MNWFKKLFGQTQETDTEKFNKESSEKLGWQPRQFGAEDFSPHLEEKIKTFQTQHELP